MTNWINKKYRFLKEPGGTITKTSGYVSPSYRNMFPNIGNLLPSQITQQDSAAFTPLLSKMDSISLGPTAKRRITNYGKVFALPEGVPEGVRTNKTLLEMLNTFESLPKDKLSNILNFNFPKKGKLDSVVKLGKDLELNPSKVIKYGTFGLFPPKEFKETKKQISTISYGEGGGVEVIYKKELENNNKKVSEKRREKLWEKGRIPWREHWWFNKDVRNNIKQGSTKEEMKMLNKVELANIFLPVIKNIPFAYKPLQKLARAYMDQGDVPVGITPEEINKNTDPAAANLTIPKGLTAPNIKDAFIYGNYANLTPTSKDYPIPSLPEYLQKRNPKMNWFVADPAIDMTPITAGELVYNKVISEDELSNVLNSGNISSPILKSNRTGLDKYDLTNYYGNVKKLPDGRVVLQDKDLYDFGAEYTKWGGGEVGKSTPTYKAQFARAAGSALEKVPKKNKGLGQIGIVGTRPIIGTSKEEISRYLEEHEALDRQKALELGLYDPEAYYNKPYEIDLNAGIDGPEKKYIFPNEYTATQAYHLLHPLGNSYDLSVEEKIPLLNSLFPDNHYIAPPDIYEMFFSGYKPYEQYKKEIEDKNKIEQEEWNKLLNPSLINSEVSTSQNPIKEVKHPHLVPNQYKGVEPYQDWMHDESHNYMNKIGYPIKIKQNGGLISSYQNGGFAINPRTGEQVPIIGDDNKSRLRNDDRNLFQKANNWIYSEYQQHKPQLFKDFPITDIPNQLVSYVTGHSDPETGGIQVLPGIGKLDKALLDINVKGIKSGLSKAKIAEEQLEKLGITSTQRKGYIPGVSDVLHKTIDPRGYPRPESFLEDLKKQFSGNLEKKVATTNIHFNYINKGRDDAWRMYLGLPQKYNTFRIPEADDIGDFFPHKKGSETFSLVDPPMPTRVPAVGKYDIGSHSAVMGNYGQYTHPSGVEYYDFWDLEPPLPLKYKGKNVKLPVAKFIGKPFETRGVIPFDRDMKESFLRQYGPTEARKLTYQQGGIIQDNNGYIPIAQNGGLIPSYQPGGLVIPKTKEEAAKMLEGKNMKQKLQWFNRLYKVIPEDWKKEAKDWAYKIASLSNAYHVPESVEINKDFEGGAYKGNTVAIESRDVLKLGLYGDETGFTRVPEDIKNKNIIPSPKSKYTEQTFKNNPAYWMNIEIYNPETLKESNVNPLDSIPYERVKNETLKELINRNRELKKLTPYDEPYLGWRADSAIANVDAKNRIVFSTNPQTQTEGEYWVRPPYYIKSPDTAGTSHMITEDPITGGKMFVTGDIFDFDEEYSGPGRWNYDGDNVDPELVKEQAEAMRNVFKPLPFMAINPIKGVPTKEQVAKTKVPVKYIGMQNGGAVPIAQNGIQEEKGYTMKPGFKKEFTIDPGGTKIYKTTIDYDYFSDVFAPVPKSEYAGELKRLNEYYNAPKTREKLRKYFPELSGEELDKKVDGILKDAISTINSRRVYTLIPGKGEEATQIIGDSTLRELDRYGASALATRDNAVIISPYLKPERLKSTIVHEFGHRVGKVNDEEWRREVNPKTGQGTTKRIEAKFLDDLALEKIQPKYKPLPYPGDNNYPSNFYYQRLVNNPELKPILDQIRDGLRANPNETITPEKYPRIENTGGWPLIAPVFNKFDVYKQLDEVVENKNSTQSQIPMSQNGGSIPLAQDGKRLPGEKHPLYPWIVRDAKGNWPQGTVYTEEMRKESQNVKPIVNNSIINQDSIESSLNKEIVSSQPKENLTIPKGTLEVDNSTYTGRKDDNKQVRKAKTWLKNWYKNRENTLVPNFFDSSHYVTGKKTEMTPEKMYTSIARNIDTVPVVEGINMGGAMGLYWPDSHRINILSSSMEYDMPNLIHELTHSSDRMGSAGRKFIRELMDNPEYYRPSTASNSFEAKRAKKDELTLLKELRPQVMEERYKNNLDPIRKYTYDELYDIGTFVGWRGFTKKGVEKIYNELSENKDTNRNQYEVPTTKSGGSIKKNNWLSKYQKGKIIKQREDFKGNFLSPLANNIVGNGSELGSLLFGIEGSMKRRNAHKEMYDLYNYYLGQPLEHNILEWSNYRPTDEKDKSSKYVSINNDDFTKQVLDIAKEENIKEGETKNVSGYYNRGTNWFLTPAPSEDLVGKTYTGYSGRESKYGATLEERKKLKESRNKTAAIGNFRIGKGKDEKGDYYSYYDIFDRGEGRTKNRTFGTAKPFEIYGRIYIKRDEKGNLIPVKFNKGNRIWNIKMKL